MPDDKPASPPAATPEPAAAAPGPAPAAKKPLPPTARPPMPKEIGGPTGPEPTRYGDWERKGRVSDF